METMLNECTDKINKTSKNLTNKMDNIKQTIG